MVGQCLMRGRYRYYRCRRSYGGVQGQKCSSRYISADLLERRVFAEISALLADPELVIREASILLEQDSPEGDRANLENELRAIEHKQRRLVQLYIDQAIPDHMLAEESNKLSLLRNSVQSRLKAAEPGGGQVDVAAIKRSLPAILPRLRDWILAANDEDAELILNALSVEVVTGNDLAQIHGTIPIALPPSSASVNGEDLVTTARTSA
jgi:hypothetical protein